MTNTTHQAVDINLPHSNIIAPVHDAHLNIAEPVISLHQFKKNVADIVQGGGWNDNRGDEGWKLVQSRRTRNRFIGKTGTAAISPSEKFKAASPKIPLFITYVNPGASVSDITAYIKNKTQEDVTLEMIHMKKDKWYNAYKLYVSKNNLQLFLNDNLWPDGIKFRKYVYRNNSKPQPRGTVSDNKILKING